MCRWVAHIGKEVFLDTVLLEGKNSLTDQSLNCIKGDPSVNGDGFGLGWYSENKNEPGVYRDVMPAWHDPNMLSLSQNIKSPLFFGHIRAATGGAISRENCHPFKYKNYMFMHNGMIQNYSKYSRCLESLLDDEFYKLRVGSTDSEVIFYLLLKYGFFQNSLSAIKQLINTIENILNANKINEEQDFLRMSLCLSDGEKIYLIRYSTNPKPPSVFYKKSISGWTLASEPTDENIDEWHEVEEGSLLIFNKQDVQLNMI